MRLSNAGRRLGRRLLFSWVAGLMLAGTPATARAGCLEDAVASCNADFSGSGVYAAAARGWCYMIRWGWCEVADQ